MSEAIGPRVYLVGRILQVLLGLSSWSDTDRGENDAAVVEAVRLADLALDTMEHGVGKPDFDRTEGNNLLDNSSLLAHT